MGFARILWRRKGRFQEEKPVWAKAAEQVESGRPGMQCGQSRGREAIQARGKGSCSQTVGSVALPEESK